MLVNCDICQKQFDRKIGEINRIIKRGWKIYCSIDCYKHNCGTHLGEYLGNGNTKYLVPDNRRDHLSPFRYFAKNAKSRNNKKNCDTILSSEYLKQIWEAQKGICPLSGWKLYLPATSSEWDAGIRVKPNYASLDRIDSSKPYEEGNVRFIAFIANMCKHQFSDSDVFKFCEAVINNKHTEGAIYVEI